ncbi:hypothetical protein ACRRTK_009808 [Alexandromys fortis]
MTGTLSEHRDFFPFASAPSKRVFPGRGTSDTNVGIPGLGASSRTYLFCPLGRRDP